MITVYSNDKYLLYSNGGVQKVYTGLCNVDLDGSVLKLWTQSVDAKLLVAIIHLAPGERFEMMHGEQQ